MRKHLTYMFLLSLAFLCTCSAGDGGRVTTKDAGPAIDARFAGHWSDGLAEVSTYALDQARYGELRQGTSVSIFVKEEFGVHSHVKWEGSDAEHTTVLKLNRLDRFTTGSYDYHLMTSVFDPLDRTLGGHAMKVTATMQDWCGHAFARMDLRDDGHFLELRSYFEEEGDVDKALGDVLLEDELWTRLRMFGPQGMDTGITALVPAATYLRMMHWEARAYAASLAVEGTGTDTARVVITYPELDRTLTIVCDAAFPWSVWGWTETRPDGFGAERRVLTSRARLLHRERIDYWNRNALADSTVRRRFGL